MVYRIYVEKKEGFNVAAASLLHELQSFLGIDGLKEIRLFNRYDVEGIDGKLFEYCCKTVFSEPQTDVTYNELPRLMECRIFAAEYLPGQFDQRADSAAQCIQLISQSERPTVRTAKIFALMGDVTDDQFEKIKAYVINPVDSREASFVLPDTLELSCETPGPVPLINGFISFDDKSLENIIQEYGLAMDMADIKFCQEYFKSENRDPSLAEIRVIDTYWSDHCRHTTFLTQIENVSFENETAKNAYERYIKIREELGVKKPVSLMDMATIGAKYLKSTGKLKDLDESEEINACTVKVKVESGGRAQDWLLLFKNETHNHPTEIEPFGGAATCIGGAIRDPLSGRGYVYQAMRITGAGDPFEPHTLPGKLPQRKIAVESADGYSSYGNQIGLATGIVDEIYHPGYVAKHMELGAVVGAAPAENVRRERPLPGDAVVLIGGRTGRDGCGGATGSSKAHNAASLDTCSAEVQKGNAPEERKLQRLFRDREAASMIKRCNDFGAGGVSVAIGELADGLDIDLNAVPRKYEGLSGVELAISESQERMAVVLEEEDVPRFLELAGDENLEATVVARVTDDRRLVMRHNGCKVVDISRDFLDSNGAAKHTDVCVAAPAAHKSDMQGGSFEERMIKLASDLNICSKRGLCERFDSTIGAGTVIMPFGGIRQRTPAQAMAARLPVLNGKADTCSVMAYGFDPYLSESDPFEGAYAAVVHSVSKVIAAGADISRCWLTLQEFFEKLRSDPLRWGKPTAALLGALCAQLDLGLAAIGGKDSMSGSFDNLDVPPTLVSFAVAMADIGDVISPEFKRVGSDLMLIAPEGWESGRLSGKPLLEVLGAVSRLIKERKAVSAFALGRRGIAEAVLKMSLGNGIGAKLDVDSDLVFKPCYGGFIVELAPGFKSGTGEGDIIGHTSKAYRIEVSGGSADLHAVEQAYESRLEPIYPTQTQARGQVINTCSYKASEWPRPAVKIASPRVLIPVFPGTNCEYDTAEALKALGAEPDILVIKNLTSSAVEESAHEFARRLSKSQILFIPGGFSSGDEPDGSGKFITAFMRNPLISERISDLLDERDGLICGVCNGFQALIKLGLVPYGEIREAQALNPTLTYNRIARHQSRLVRTRVASNKSPWLMRYNVGDVHLTPVSHGEGRFVCSAELLEKLERNGQIATQYADLSGAPSMDMDTNPNGSDWAVEGITSPDGRIFGRMAHSERCREGLYKNVPGNYVNDFFRGAVDYFRL